MFYFPSQRSGKLCFKQNFKNSGQRRRVITSDGITLLLGWGNPVLVKLILVCSEQCVLLILVILRVVLLLSTACVRGLLDQALKSLQYDAIIQDGEADSDRRHRQSHEANRGCAI